MTDPDPPSALDVLESEVKRSLRARALELERRLGPLEGAVLAYRRALEAEVARDYAAAHSLRFERPAGKTRLSAATALHELVMGLPELAPHAAEPELLPADPGEPADRLDPARLDRARLDPARLDPARKAIADVLPHIAAELAERTLVILGSLGGRKRELPEALAARTEWIDTSQGGAHAVGNLPARVRQGRVLGIVICEQAISHKHTEPVVAAARGAGVPVGFAGKGGNAGIARALRAIEQQLGDGPDEAAGSGSSD